MFSGNMDPSHLRVICATETSSEQAHGIFNETQTIRETEKKKKNKFVDLLSS